ncbi:hypothetical protein ACFWIA_04975 [Streptomyces sp. NPDC127068]|uniref:hypothetical protein n=1 Tax=Streptomyces sp. NPDC127068 TaxID=3347127 RepID=UPI003669EDDE
MQGASGYGRLDGNRTGRPRRARLFASMVGVTAVVLLAGACSTDKETPADSGSSASAKAKGKGGEAGEKSTLAYAKCMREKGVSNFPDPNEQGRLDIDGTKVDMKSAVAQAADKACKPLLPPMQAKPPAEVQEASVKYAKCMRTNGVPKFPDPNSEGGIDINGDSLGVDPNSQAYKDADKKCKPILDKVASGPREFQTGGPK